MCKPTLFCINSNYAVLSIIILTQVEPSSVWLKEEFGSRAFFPENDGSFHIQPILSMNGSLKVEGVPFESQTPQHLTKTVLPSIATYTPIPAFRSVTAHRQTGGKSVSVKIVQSRLSFTESGKPTFEKIGQMFVDVGEGTATVPYIQSTMRAEFGSNYTLVTNDGLELHDSAGTQG